MPTPIFLCLPSSPKPQESEHTASGHGPDCAELAGVPVSYWPDATGSIFKDGTTSYVTGLCEIKYGNGGMILMPCAADISGSTPRNMSSSSEGVEQPHDRQEEKSAKHAHYTRLPPPDNSLMCFVPLNGIPVEMQEVICGGPRGEHTTLAVGPCEGALCPGFILFKLPHENRTPFKNLYAIGALKQVGNIHGPKDLTSLEKMNGSKFRGVPETLVAKLESELVAVRLRLGNSDKLSGHTLDIYIYVDQLPTVALQLYFSESPPNELELVLPTAQSFPIFVSSIVKIIVYIDRVAVSNGFECPLFHLLVSKQFISVRGIQIELAMNLKPGPAADDADVHGSLQHTCSILKALENSLTNTLKLDSSITSPLQSANVLLCTAASNIKPNARNGSEPHQTSSSESEGHALDQVIQQSDPPIAAVTPVSESLVALAHDLASFCTSYEGVWRPTVIRKAAEIIAHGALLIERKGHITLLSILGPLGKYLRSVDAARTFLSHVAQVSDDLVAGNCSLHPAYAPSPSVTMFYDEPLSTLFERPFDLGPSVTIQRIRLIDCDELVRNRRLQVLEVLDHHDLSQIQYSAVSYVWRGVFDGKILPASYPVPSGAFVVQGVEQDGDPINIDVVISAARASLKGGSRYMWLDRLCILQDNRPDKCWQLEKMHLLYRNCKRCIIIPNGLLSLIPPEKNSPWLTRMWTLEEGLVPADPQVLFSWTYGPGILVQGQCEDEEKAIGYIDEIEPGVGLIPLLFLTQQKFGTKLFFRDYAGNPKTDVIFNLLGDGRLDNVSRDGGLEAFADAADSFRPQGDIALIRREDRYKELWRSALVRDVTNRDDIIVVLSGLLSLQRQDDPTLLGKRQYTLDESQKSSLVLVVDSIYDRHSSGGRDERAEWATRRLKYDMWYGFEMHIKRPRLGFQLPDAYCPPPSHLCIKIPDPPNSDSSCLSAVTPGSLDSLLTNTPDAYASIRILSLHGCSPATTDAHPSLSTEILQSLLRCLPRLSDLELRSWTLDFTMMDHLSLDRPIILQHLKLVDVQPVQSRHEPLAFLLSLFDTEVLCINSPPFAKTLATSSLTTEAGFSNLQNAIIDNVRNIYMHCDTNVMVLWLRALGRSPSHNTIGDALPAGDANRPSTLRTVDIVCSDMPAAYALGDFLRTDAARSVEHLIIDISQSCVKDWPIDPEDIGLAILHHQPRSFHTLTIRLNFLIEASMQRDLRDYPSILLTGAHMARRLISILATAPAMLKTLNLEIDLVSLDPLDKIQFTVTSVLRSIASAHVCGAIANCMNMRWPNFSSLEHVNIVWRRPAHRHQGCTIDANDLVIGLIPAIHEHNSGPDAYYTLTEEQVSEANSLVEKLTNSGFMTSRWDTYEREEEENPDAQPVVGGWTAPDPAKLPPEHEIGPDVHATAERIQRMGGFYVGRAMIATKKSLLIHTGGVAI